MFMGRESESDVFEELKMLCMSKGYIHVVALLSLINNVTFYNDELVTEVMQQQYDKDKLIRTELSTVIGLFLQGDIDLSFPSNIEYEQLAEKTYELLHRIHNAMFTTKTDKYGNLMIKESVFYSGESAYDFQYLDMASQKYNNDEDWINENMGFSFSELVIVGRTIDLMINEQVEGFINKKIDSKNEGLLDAYSINLDCLAKKTGVEGDVVKKIIDLFSSCECSNNQFCSIGDFNSFNAKPIIYKDGRYYSFLPYSLSQSIYETPFFWMNDDKKYRPKSAKNRGQFTEDYAYEKLAKIFGRNNVHKNVFILNNKKETLGEIDVLVNFSDCLVIFQAKSKKLTIEARKGNDNAIQKDFQGAVQDAYDQGVSCAQLILTENKLTDSQFNPLVIKHDTSTIYIVPIISEHYPALSFQIHQYLKVTTADNIHPPFVMDVFLLDVLAEFLSSPLYFLSYLDRRSRYGSKILSSHELTNLAFHLKQNLWMEDGCDMFMLHDDLCSDLDIAMLARRKGINGKITPEGILTLHQDGFIRRIIKSLEMEDSKIAVELGFILLSMSSDTINDLNEVARKSVCQTRLDKKHHDFSTIIGGIGITFHSNYYDNDVAKRKLLDHCERRKYISKTNKWIGVLIVPETYEIRLAVMLDFDWIHSFQMEEATNNRSLKNTIIKKDGVMIPLKKLGRNEECTCGSGKKYKKCCLR